MIFSKLKKKKKKENIPKWKSLSVAPVKHAFVCLFVCFALSLHMRNSLFIPVPKYSRPIIDARHLRVD